MNTDTQQRSISLANQEPANGNEVVTVTACSGPANSAGATAVRSPALTFRMPLLFIGHSLVFTAAYILAFHCRFDFSVPTEIWQWLFHSIPVVIVTKNVVFFSMGHFHGWWRHVTFADLVGIVRSTFVSFVLLVVIGHFFDAITIPRSVLVMDAMFTAMLLGIARSSWRFYNEGLSDIISGKKPKNVLMVGSDYANGVMAHQIHSNPQLSYRVRGFVDESLERVGRRLGNIRVLGVIDHLGQIAKRYGVVEVLIIAGSLTGSRLRRVMDLCQDNQLELKIIPRGLEQATCGKVPVRDVNINDLLRREPVQLDTTKISHQINGRRVMVTGAGGSIGSEICRQLLKFEPFNLILLDHRENSVFEINNELSRLTNQTTLHPLVGDILDMSRMRAIFEQYQPEFVYHAAAHKHVGLMEENAGESVKNNVFGTKSIADLSHKCGVKKFVLISTDKAVNPTSVMGATKHVAERYVHAMAQESETAYVVVRFGNVLGSNGSVVPLFKEQIARGGPITITDQRMTRFFMTIPEASQLVLQAAAMGRGGEIFVLEMGDQLSIVNLAEDLIRLSGLPQDSVDIKFVGIRPGEKLYEELYFDEEEMLETDHPKVHAAYHRHFSLTEVQSVIDDLTDVLNEPNLKVREALKQAVPNFQRQYPDANLRVADTPDLPHRVE